jgi:hypothetical protein
MFPLATKKNNGVTGVFAAPRGLRAATLAHPRETRYCLTRGAGESPPRFFGSFRQ